MSIDDRDEDDATPVAAPEAKKRFPLRRPSSASMQAVNPNEIHECPKCSATGAPCTLCKRTGKVKLTVATDYILNGNEPIPDTDPAPPTERNDR